MLFPEKMFRVEIGIEPQYSDAVLERIGLEGVLHIEKIKAMPENEAEASRVKTLLTLTLAYMKFLEIIPRHRQTHAGPSIDQQLNEIENTLSAIGSRIEEVSQELRASDQELQWFHKAAAIKNALLPVVDVETLSKNLNYLRFRVAIVTMEAAELLRLSAKHTGLLLIDRPLFEQTSAIAIFYEEEQEPEVLKGFNTVKAIEMNQVYFSEQAYKLQQLTGQKLHTKREILSKEYETSLQNSQSHLRNLHELEVAKSSLRESPKGMILGGWIPKKSAKNFVADIEHAKVTFLEHEGEAPVLLDTPSALKPFEKLITNFSYPRYGEINPILPFAFSFLLLFGIMFGDVGHGLILAFLGWLVKKNIAKYADFGQIYYLSGLSAAFFGLLYGSVFGVHHLLPHLLFSPLENIQATIIFSIGIGIAIITLSFLLHMVTAIKRKEPTLLFVSEGSLLWLLVYWFTIGIFIKSVVQELDITYEAILLSLLLIIIFIQLLRKTGQGSQAVIDLLREFMDTITNTLSFLRVGAFALAHGALFMAVFSIARMISESYGEGLIYWILIIIGNVVIIVLEGVIVTIQTLRLEYYEFFKRFFKGGGIPYQPYTLGGKDEN